MTESLEDYLEIIYQLTEQNSFARVKDIAEKKGVRMASVTSALQRLKREGYIHYAAHEKIRMTPDGRKTAKLIHKKHHIIKSFLVDVLQIPEEVAEVDSCGIEHHTSSQTIHRLLLFQQALSTVENKNKEFMKTFIELCQKDTIQ
jgi:DtxR family Mn-dependent transcriptional regulator